MRPEGPDEQIPVTGAVTEFRLDGLPEGEYDLVVRARGFTEDTQRVRVQTGREPARASFSLRPGTPVRCRVVEQGSGRPIPGARLAFGQVRRSVRGWGMSFEGDVAMADAGGQALILLRPGEWLPMVTAEGFSNPEDPSDGIFPVGTEPMEREFPLMAPLAAIEGTVLYEDGTPAAGAHVIVESAWFDPEAEETGPFGDACGTVAEADEHGRFRLADGVVPWAGYQLAVQARNGATLEVEEVSFEPGRRVVDLTLRLPGTAIGAAVTGRVVSEDGEPAPGVLVTFAGKVATTGPDGAFRMDAAAAGEHVATYGALGRPLHFTSKIAFDGRADLDLGDLVLAARGTRVSGRIEDTAGEGVAGVEVSAWFWFPDGFPRIWTVTADAPGRSEIEGPVGPTFDGTVHLRVFSAPGFQDAEENVPSAPAIVADVTLTRSAAVTGTLEFAGPAPTFVRAQYWHDRWGSWWAVRLEVDPATRRYEIPEILPGRRAIRFLAEGYAPGGRVDVDVREGESVEAGTSRLTPGGTITGRVLRADGSPVAGVQVAVRGEFVYTDTAADGAFRLEHVPTGAHELVLNDLPDGVTAEPAPVTVPEGRSVEANLRTAN